MKKELFDEINQAVKDRDRWEAKQELFYRMRNGGIRRRFKPYPNAPDLSYPLGDTLIEKLKPAYIQQLYGSETIASFVCRKSQDQDVTSAAAYWYDYQLKQRSNFERTMFCAIDEMLQDGFTPVKVYWDTRCKRLAFDQVDPLHLIVPKGTQEYNQGGGADWLVHVLHMSEAEYRANPLFKQDDEFIKAIKGKGSREDSSQTSGKAQAMELREGINCSANDNEIVLWEVYSRDRKSKRITIETMSPIKGHEAEDVVREPFGLPYNKGMFVSGECFPFFKIRAEIKGKGHYSSRGIMEINAPYEVSLSKSWNTIHTWGDFFANPTFSSTQAIPNTQNFRPGPGKVLPIGLTPNAAPSPPNSIREDMQMTRAIAEDRTQIPDLGSGQHLAGNTKGEDTATKTNAIMALSSQGNDMRARVLRLDLGDGLKMGWSILLQFGVAVLDATGQPDPASLAYIVNKEIRQLDPSSLHDDYEIEPTGSADSWNKGAELQQRIAFYQMFQANPFIELGEVTKWVIEAKDPRLVKRFFRDPGEQQKAQTEDQAIEIILMERGYSPEVHPADDDKTHMTCLGQNITRKLTIGETITPEFARLALEHGAGHDHQLEQKKDPMLKQIRAQAAPIIQVLQAIAQSDQANVIPISQTQAPGAGPALSPSHIASASSPGPATLSPEPQPAGATI